MSRSWLGIGVAAFALWPSCGGKSILYEDDGSEVGGSSSGVDAGGGVSGSTVDRGGVTGVGGTSAARGGVGNAPSGGDGAGGAPSGGTGVVGGMGFGGAFGGFGGEGFGGIAFGGAGAGGISFGGAAGAGFGGFEFGGVAGIGGRGRGMGGRGLGMGGRGLGMGGRGFGGRGQGPNPVDGFTFVTPCDSNPTMGPSCSFPTMGCVSSDPTLPGGHPTDVTQRMPGTPGVFYDMTVHVQGIVESKVYVGGIDQDGYTSRVDGLYFSGVPVQDSASIYLVRFTSPPQDYFFNSILSPSVQSTLTFAVDYRANIRFEGGTLVRFVSADADCSVLRNCGATMAPSACFPASVANLEPAIAADIGAQPFNGQFLGMVVESVTAL